MSSSRHRSFRAVRSYLYLALPSLALGIAIVSGLSDLDPADQVASLGSALLNGAGHVRGDEPTDAAPEVTLPPVHVRETTIKSGSNLYDALRTAGIDRPESNALIASVKKFVDLRRLAAGTPIEAYFPSADAPRPTAVELKLDELRLLRATGRADGGWDAEVHEAIVEKDTAAYSGLVSSNLWNSATQAGMDPLLISQLAEIFAWQVDFNREVQENDRWRLTVERRLVDGVPIGYGDILAAEYENVGIVYSAVRFDHDGSNGRYYAQDGQSLRRMFLKSPLKYGRITSGFSARRFHPILNISRPHLGVDYGAPTGTPVMAVGDGIITFAAHRGASGKMIAIRHNSVYETQYKHLSGFASGVRSGSHVGMGQIIGYVGSTGLSTGPHLHFEFNEGGRFVDPTGLRFPTADPVPESLKQAFLTQAKESMSQLPPWADGQVTGPTPKAVRTAAKASE